MVSTRPNASRPHPGGAGARSGAVLLGALLAGSCVQVPVLSAPQRIVLPTGARLEAEASRLEEINDWVYAQLQRVSCRATGVRRQGPEPTGWESAPSTRRQTARASYCLFAGSGVGGNGQSGSFRRGLQDPRVHVRVVPGDPDAYPWQTLVIEGDTAQVGVARTHPDVQTAYTIYAYLHLLEAQGRIERALPESAGAEGYLLERRIVERMVDAWLVGRAGLGIDPFVPMDELLYASEGGYLDAFLLTARPRAFPEAREAWLAANPGGLEAYQSWYRATLGREPPGLRTARGVRP